MTSALPWKVGLELELLAPAGSSRESLANEIARSCDGQVKRIFYSQAEFAPLDGTTGFENLTLGFAVENEAGEILVKCVDDLTLVDDLDASQEPLAGWYRILSDDQRFLSLIEMHCDAKADQLNVLEPLARLFGVDRQIIDDGPLTRVSDQRGTSVAMAVSLPGERHRPCELITAPMTSDREEQIRHYLTLAENLSFSVPVEAAIHIHFDAERLKSAAVMKTLIKVFGHYRSDIKRLVGTNPNCRRLGNWPRAIYRLASNADFPALDWDEAVKKLREAKPVKFCDFNIVNLLSENVEKNTFEVRVIPGSMDADFILKTVRLFEALLKTCATQQIDVDQRFPGLMDFIAEIGLTDEDMEYWTSLWEAKPKHGKFGFLKALKS